MAAWRVWRLVILFALIAGLAWTLIYRSPIGRSLTERATIKTPYKTEHEWAVRETAIDIERMAAYATKREPRDPVAPLPDAPWEIDSFVPIASSAFGPGDANANFQFDLYP